MFENMKLRNRILLGYSVPIFLSVLVAVVVYMSASTVGRQTKVVETKYDIVEDVDHLELGVSQMIRTFRGYLLTGDESHLKRFDDGEKVFKDAIENLRRLVSDQKVQESISKIEELETRYVAFAKGAIELGRKGKQDLAIQAFKTGEGTKLFDEIKVHLGELEKREIEILKEAKEGGTSSLNFLIRVVWGGALLSTILAVAIGLWIASRISLSISETVTSLSTTSTEIASTAEQHERTATGQAASVSETTTTVDELGASSRQSMEQADAVAAMAKEALVTTGEGINMAKQASDGMVKMKEKVEGIGGQILHLSEQTGQIGKIATMVTDIAGQINMLALNAAVEAVRAGEQGKGFAVIAQEVRKLADQGKKSAEQANAIVSDIQKATNSAVMVTEEGTKTVLEVSEIAAKAGEAFASLSGVATRVYENAQQVSLNQKQQSTAIKQVTEAMNQINAGAKETAAGIGQTKIGVQRLNEAAQNLKKMV